MNEIKQKTEVGWIHSRVLIELIGKPKEHIEKTIKTMVDKIKKEEKMKVTAEQVAEVTKKEIKTEEKGMIQEMWATFAELEILFEDLPTMTYFCFEYMPSSMEILEPQKITTGAIEWSRFFNDLQGQLHQVDLAMKQLKNRNDFLNKNFKALLNNFIMVILSGGKEFTAQELANITKAGKEALEDFLDGLIDEGKIEMAGEKYKVKIGGRDKKSS